ncbi:MAG: DUF3786 domain-containing protein [Promethearchaeota archaeon]
MELVNLEEELGRFSWDDVKDEVADLPGRLGFGDRVELAGLRVEPDGSVWAVSRDDWGRHGEEVTDPVILNDVYRLLHFYSRSEDVVVPRAEEVLTKVSQLRGGSMQCSTNQHRMEEKFKAMFDQDAARLGEILERVFHAEPTDHGDLSFRVPLLPRVPLWVVYNEEEEEDGLPSDVRLYFEAHASNFLPQIICENLENLFLVQVERLFY